jgi:hypothetical protein
MKCGRCVGLTNLLPSVSRLYKNVGSHNPIGLQGLLRGYLYILLCTLRIGQSTCSKSKPAKPEVYYSLLHAQQLDMFCVVVYSFSRRIWLHGKKVVTKEVTSVCICKCNVWAWAPERKKQNKEKIIFSKVSIFYICSRWEIYRSTLHKRRGYPSDEECTSATNYKLRIREYFQRQCQTRNRSDPDEYIQLWH